MTVFEMVQEVARQTSTVGLGLALRVMDPPRTPPLDLLIRGIGWVLKNAGPQTDDDIGFLCCL